MSLIKNLFYSVEGFELHIPQWSLPERGITALSGPSGSGKTTIIKILCGLLPVKNLEWHFKGKDLAKFSPPDRCLGALFQDLRLFPHLSARKNILFAARARRLSFETVRPEFEELVSSLKLEGKLSLFPENLSGGERQRVALARALIHRPRFLFLDEPFSHLDEKTRREARTLTLEVLRGKNIPALLVSHNAEDVKELADKVFFLKEGRLSERGF